MTPLDSSYVSIVILTSSYSITGDLALQTRRLSEYLNDRRDTVVILRDASIARIADPVKIIAKCPEAAIPKDWINLAFEVQQHADSQAKRFYGYIKKQTYDVFIALHGVEIRGLLHLTTPLELKRIVAASMDSFLPLTQVAVTLISTNRYVLKPDAVMVNAKQIHYIAQVQSEPEPKT